MNKEEKKEAVEAIVEKIQESAHFYLADIAEINSSDTQDLRKQCFEKDIELVVVKNTLLQKALEQVEGNFEGIENVLKGGTSIMFCNTGNIPAKLIKSIREKGKEKPVLKAAYVEEELYVGDDQLDMLCSIKSKDELIGDIIGLLQSPITNLVGALQSGGNTISGLVKALEEKAQ